MGDKRLTETYTYRNNEGLICSEFALVHSSGDALDQVIEKLGYLEDIEEELGIGLGVIAHIFDRGICYDGKHICPRDLELCKEGKSIIVYEHLTETLYCELPFEEFNKTWTLSKTEDDFTF